MIGNKKIIVVMPAYNAVKTLEKTCNDLDMHVVDDILVVDDASADDTVNVCKKLGLPVIEHARNMGYGANQKTCYAEALRRGGDIIIMVHPDYQYEPKIAPALAGLLAYGVYDIAIGSRILGKSALKGGMPRHKYIANRILTFIQNLLCGYKLSEYHTGYRAFTAEVLKKLPLGENSDGFLFDNEVLAQAIIFNYRIGEVSCPTKYFEEASSIDFANSVRYGLGVLGVSLKAFLERVGLFRFRIFAISGKKLGG